MKKFIQLLISQLNVFLGNTAPKTSEEDENEYAPIIDTIQLALYKKTAVHVIYANQKSITGTIVKWDAKRHRLIVENFSKSMSAMIQLHDIQKISFVPDAIKTSQKNAEPAADNNLNSRT